MMTPACYQRLALPPDADQRTIRRAYARELKLIDQEADPVAFQRLRAAYEEALYRASQGAELHESAGPAPAAAAPSADSTPSTLNEMPPESVDDVVAEPPYAQLGHAAFAAFVERVRSEARLESLADYRFWSTQLQCSLDAPQLVGIEARMVFEYCIASLLTQGWHPGHEALLVAAAELFFWTEDRRKLQHLGHPGQVMDRVLDEHAIFGLQDEKVRWQQSKLIARLRNPAAPSNGELVAANATLTLLQTRYPNWLAVVTDSGAISTWQQAYERVPEWRRRLAPVNWFQKSEDPLGPSSYSSKWLWALMIVGVIRVCIMFGSDHRAAAPDPAPHTQAGTQLHVGDYLQKANQMMDRGEFSAAIHNYGIVIDMAPNNFMAYLNRGLAYLELGDDRQAESDFNRSGELEQDNYALHAARGKLALYRNQPQEAITRLNRAIEMMPTSNAPILLDRATAYASLHQYDLATADVHSALAGLNAPQGDYLLAMRIALQQGRQADAASEAGLVLSRYPRQPQAYEDVTWLYHRFNLQRSAMAVADQGIKLVPTARLLRWRARSRAPTDLAGRRADLAQAAQLAPNALSVVQDRFDLETGAGDLKAASKIIELAIARTAPADWRLPALLALRGILHTRGGDAQAARMEFDAALVAAVSAEQKNEVCWSMATRNTALETALLICNRALTQAPHNAAIRDSRGLVLLRLGRNRDALASYDAALAARHDQAVSLLGRSIARRRLGDAAGGKIDAEAALSIDPGLRQEYAGYGLTF